MAYAFSITHGGVKKRFGTPPAGVSPDMVERVIAIAFDIPARSFGIKSCSDGEVGYVHNGILGDWDLVLIRSALFWPFSCCVPFL